MVKDIAEPIHYALRTTSLGRVLVARSARGLCAVLLGDTDDALLRELGERFPQAALEPGEEGMEALAAEVIVFLEAPGRTLAVPLDLRGTAFQRRVWEALRAIPAGETASYTEIAERIGQPRAVRAVGRACGANALGVVVPCHRAVRRDGSLSGYRWGVARKRALLEREARAGVGR